MKPVRMKLAHHLLLSYGLYRQLEVYVRAVGRFFASGGTSSRPGRQLPALLPLPPADQTQRPHLATAEEMMEFHSSDYIDFLQRITPENMHEYASAMNKYGVGEFSDCPVFSGLYDYTRIHAGASIGETGPPCGVCMVPGARRLRARLPQPFPQTAPCG